MSNKIARRNWAWLDGESKSGQHQECTTALYMQAARGENGERRKITKRKSNTLTRVEQWGPCK